MTKFIEKLKAFELSSQQETALCSDFELILSDTNLIKCERVSDIIANYKKVSGIYFWVMRYGNQQFRIYIGKTNSMSYRMQNYVSEFQPHSPNDYKMRVFHSYIAKIEPKPSLDLYFSPREILNITQSENDAICFYSPFLNKRQKATQEARDAVRDAFSCYYQSGFEQLLKL